MGTTCLKINLWTVSFTKESAFSLTAKKRRELLIVLNNRCGLDKRCGEVPAEKSS